MIRGKWYSELLDRLSCSSDEAITYDELILMEVVLEATINAIDEGEEE